MRITISNRSESSCDEPALRSVLDFASEKVGLSQECELSLSIVTTEEMSELHLRWMDEAGATDVLSFPMDEIKLGQSGPGILGDIVLCPEFAESGAARAATTLDEEMQLLAVHGLLHLLGLDHREHTEEKAMFALQGEILREWRSHP